MMMLNSWLALIVAIIFGVMGTISMKLSNGLTRTKPALFLALFYTICFIALTFALKHLELSMVYAVWSGAGTVLISAIGIFYLHESVSLRKVIFLALIVIGVIGMHLNEGLTQF
jgi:small multidrug resistance pump